MNTFKTLLLREWMQHHKGWLTVMILPLVLILGVCLYTPVHVSDDLWHVPNALVIGSIFAVTGMVFSITWIVTMLQAPGMARRDQQDRSIEFWSSLPVSHTASVGATVLMQLLLVPLLALAVGYAGSLVVGVVGVSVESGPAGLAEVGWSNVLMGSLATLVYLVFGVTLATLWLSPIVLVAMVASAWLKRWGVPALGAALAGGHVALSGFYGITVIGDTLRELWVNALYSIVHDGHPAEFKFRNSHELFSQWPVTPGQLLEGAQISLSNLAQPLFAFAVVMAVASFVLLVLRRSRA